MILLGLMSFVSLLYQDPKRASLINMAQVFNLISGSVIAGLIGGHLVHFAMQPTWTWIEAISFWKGLSILGTAVGVIGFLSLFFKQQGIPVLPLLDLVAIYSPLVIGFGRIGCFMAGCCYGTPTSVAWAITYTNPLCKAPLGVSLHPTQLYSATFFFGFFLLMRFVLQYKAKKPGQLIALLFIFISLERFIIAFFRTDHLINNSYISHYQWFALGLCGLGVVSLGLLSYRKPPSSETR